MRRSPEELAYVEAEFEMQTTEDGGRQSPIRSGYRPNWWLWLAIGGEPTNAGGTLELVDATDLAPGATARIRIYPFVPEAWHGAEVGTQLEAREGPMLVGRAIVTRVAPTITLTRSA